MFFKRLYKNFLTWYYSDSILARVIRSSYRKGLLKAFHPLKTSSELTYYPAIKLANTFISYQSNRIDIENINNIKLLSILGPYRNLSSFTSAVLALHPNIQVLNHSYNTVITEKTNFIKKASNTRINEFIRRATFISSKRTVELFGNWIIDGSILDSHAFFNYPDVMNTYENRFGSAQVKDSFQVMVWKESGRLTDYLMRYEKTLINLLDHFPRIKFILPVRNPIDCAISNYKLSYHKLLSFEGRSLYESIPSDSLEGMLEYIIYSHVWCLRFAENYPDRFFVFSQTDVDYSLFAKLAKFLEVKNDDVWIRDGLKISNFKAHYAYHDNLINTYIKLLEKYNVNSISNRRFLTDWTFLQNRTKENL
ncbi:MAG: hypothetical protein VSS75_018205 [Candidatus Parabeggiatoa sp.]|nr:hypothetical protein [Candidatus Parabeggiatoa sp.]